MSHGEFPREPNMAELRNTHIYIYVDIDIDTNVDIWLNYGIKSYQGTLSNSRYIP